MLVGPYRRLGPLGPSTAGEYCLAEEVETGECVTLLAVSLGGWEVVKKSRLLRISAALMTLAGNDAATAIAMPRAFGETAEHAYMAYEYLVGLMLSE